MLRGVQQNFLSCLPAMFQKESVPLISFAIDKQLAFMLARHYLLYHKAGSIVPELLIGISDDVRGSPNANIA